MISFCEIGRVCAVHLRKRVIWYFRGFLHDFEVEYVEGDKMERS